MVINNGNQITTNRNLNPTLNSTPIQNPKHDSDQFSPPVSCFPLEDPANWDNLSLLAAIVRPNKRPPSGPFIGAENRTPVPNPSSQIETNSGVATDGFPIPYRPYYNLNLPLRSDQRKQMESQGIPAKDAHVSQGKSQREKEDLVLEEGEELGIDLNKTPKVIREGQGKKTELPKDPNNMNSNGRTQVKRKYVSEKGVNINLNINPQYIEERRAMKIAQNNIYTGVSSTHQESSMTRMQNGAPNMTRNMSTPMVQSIRGQFGQTEINHHK